MVITQNGKAAGVLIAPKVYEDLIYQRSLICSINRGLRDVENGDVLSTDELRDELSRRRS